MSELEWSKDGKLLAVGSVAGVTVYETNSFKKIGYQHSESGIVNIAFSPDGRYLAFSSGWPSTFLTIWDIQSGQVENIHQEDLVYDVIFSQMVNLLYMESAIV